MMKTSTIVLILSIFSISVSIAQIENNDNPKERIEHEIRITIDPKLGRVP